MIYQFNQYSLDTDQYQLTMAQTYFRHGLHGNRVQFDYTFRRNPDYGTHQAGFCVFAGLGPLLDWMESARFGAEEIAALAAQKTTSGAPRFDTEFLEWLGEHGHFGEVAIEAVGEGRVVHPYCPLAIVTGPLASGAR